LDNKVITGYLQKWPFSKLRKYLPVLRIWWFEHLNLQDYDIIISSSGNGEAKGIKQLKEGAVHICYCHTPTHFYWDKYDEYLKNPGFGAFNPLAHMGLRLLVSPLRNWDLKTAKRPNFFIANSTHIQTMIKKYYKRDSVVIHPPVDIERFRSLASNNNRQGFVTVGRQTPYKHTDIIIKACTKLKVPLTVIGNGPEHKKLQKMAGRNITLIRQASDHDIELALTAAKAFIFAANEDFGITPVEAMAAGTPVIAYEAGGALDYVNPKTGIFFEQQTTNSVIKSLQAFNSKQFDRKDLINQANEFSKDKFKTKFTDCLETVCAS
jgi:glycosyltransferase involved in cell wall biosynthesis